MDELTEATPPATTDGAGSEAGSLARAMARAYVEMVRFHRDQMDQTPAEADGEIADLAAFHTERVLDAPPDEVGWSALGLVAERDPERAHAAWERITAEARDELESGHRAALTLVWHGRPWERAQFLAIRQAFIDEWQPQGGIEGALIDTMAQAQTMYLLFLSRLQAQALGEGMVEDHKHPPRGAWQTPRLDVAAAMDQSAAMADRFNRLFMRTLRHLRDLRRYAPAVVVQQAGQVNVGGQQVNVAQGCERNGPNGMGAAADRSDD